MSKVLDEYIESFEKKEDENIPVPSLSVAIGKEEKEELRVLSGYESIDEITDFRSGNTYLIGGYEKSGKSSFAFGILTNLFKKHKVAFFNTELTDKEFVVALTAITHDISKKEAEEQSSLRDLLIKVSEDKLIYAGLNQLSENNKLSFSKTLELANNACKAGAKIFFFDNLTTYASQTTERKRGWEILAGCVSDVISFTKSNNVISFIVIHTRPDTVFSETPQGIRRLVEQNLEEEVFDKSLTVVRRPSGNDIYGGGGIRSQVSGTILVWRPFQMFDKSPQLQQLTQIILENFRHSQGGTARFIFHGEKGIFEEDKLQGVMENLKEK